jgi:hypothetical protein
MHTLPWHEMEMKGQLYTLEAYIWGKIPWYLFDRRLDESESPVWTWVRRDKSLPILGIKPLLLCCPACILVLLPTELFWLLAAFS